jgi:hypothetical protein
MAGFTGVYNLANQRLTAQRDEVEREHRALTESEQVTLVSWFMLRNDIENYFLFGDPSAAVAQA